MTTALTLTPGQHPDGSTVLRAVGEIDMSNVDSLAAAIDEQTTTSTPLVVDLSAVDYLDSAGLTVLFARAHQIHLITGPLLAPLLVISGLAQLTTVHGLGSDPTS
ncbi:STAS domain-containing protein [Kitasatospora sp. NBC_01287]|uniref:STAS domain-containing protein n=1 Tax=Kitasatospora sp. NBC_01287 TaxID=2903573 RepID=UPI00225A6586|nr:STAS domain-containing protein [Kitasatospora sp. NBC_01287]MCX4751045.1 STAS domain-containing protein [Kitasatospora sp. NBC_01287]